MAPRLKSSTFPGLDGFPSIIQDEMALLRSIFIGKLVADRDHYRSSRPGMNVGDVNRITDPVEREAYSEICSTLNKTLRYARTQMKNTKAFFDEIGFDYSETNFNSQSISMDNMNDLQERLKDRYRLVLVKYHTASRLCSLEWHGDYILPRVIYIATDGEKWDVLNSTNGIFKKFLCSACLTVSETYNIHRCKYTCFSCSSLLLKGNCNGDLNKICEDCGFTFKTQECYDIHKHSKSNIDKNRCDSVKYCIGCDSVYRPSNGTHVCGQSIYCVLCRDYTNNQHQCKWPRFTEKTRLNLMQKQTEFRYAFFDIESTQAPDFDDDEIPDFYPHHYCTTIALIKVCYMCEKKPIDERCGNCGTRKVIFQYQNKDEDPYLVVDKFCTFLMEDKTMKNRTLYSHNGGRFDTHLVLRGFLRKGIRPQLVNKGTTIIRAETKLREGCIILKDSFTAIPIALAEFPKAFDLPCDVKGNFPHLANTREFWGKVWDSVPPKRYFNYKFMKPEAQKEFDEWHASMEGKPWDQDAELEKYCMLDVEICMLGCLKYRSTMIEQTSWCPFTTANTLAAFCQFQLRAEYMNHLTMPYLPENGYGAINQSAFALKYIKWLERDSNIRLQHAHSPFGEKKIKIGQQLFSLDCYEEALDRVIEIMGCYYHGCPSCYLDGTELIGGQRSADLFERTAARIRLLRTKFKTVEVVWECEINAMLLANPEMKEFFKTTEIMERLKLRDALYGGRVEVLRTFLKSSAETVIKYYDICSMYPSCMALREYPLGFPEVITANFKPVVGDIFPYRGIAKVRVIAPPNLRIAVLPQRSHNSLIFGLCGPCVDNKEEECSHYDPENPEKRSWVGTYASVELNLALQRGYKVTAVYEVWHWEEWSDQVYRGYFQKFMRMKFAASGFPSNVNTQDEQEDYCSKINQKLDFGLTPSDIDYSSSRRTVSKFCNNACWGKLAEVPTHRKVEYLSNKEYAALKLDASREIVDAEFEADDIIRVTHKPKAETIRANKFSAVHHAIFVTAYARVLLYTIIEKAGSRAAYMDTDSIFFEMDRDGEDPLAHLLTGELGELTDEMKSNEEIVEAVFAGCKSYSLKIFNHSTGKTTTKLASKGFSKDANTLEILKHDVVKNITLTKKPEFIPISRPELKRKMGEISTVQQTKRYRPTSVKRATRGEGECEFKVPFGYIE